MNDMGNKIKIIVGGRNHSKTFMSQMFNEFYRENPQFEISELLFGKCEYADCIDVTNERKLIGYDTNGDVFEDTYSHFYEFDTHDLKNK